MSSWMAKRREERLFYDGEDTLLDDRTYNIALGSVVMYGLVLNIILCAVLGNRMMYVNPLVLIIGYVVCCIAGVIISSKSHSPAISFIGYNLVVVPVGLVLSVTISGYVMAGAGALIMQAIVYTTVTTAAMIALSVMFPDFFSKIGTIMLGVLVGFVLSEIIALIFFPGSQNMFAWIGAGIFALYIGYDFWRAQQFPKTLDNAVDCALDIYLDIINLFLRILRILGSKGSRRR